MALPRRDSCDEVKELRELQIDKFLNPEPGKKMPPKLQTANHRPTTSLLIAVSDDPFPLHFHPNPNLVAANRIVHLHDRARQMVAHKPCLLGEFTELIEKADRAIPRAMVKKPSHDELPTEKDRP